MIRKKHITLCFSLFLALSMVLGQLIPVTATDEVPAETPATVGETVTPAPELVKLDPEPEAGEEPGVTPTEDETPDPAGEGGPEPTAPAGDGQGEEATIPTEDASYPEKIVKTRVGNAEISATYDSQSGLPEEAAFMVEEVIGETADAYKEWANNTLTGDVTFAQFFDIWFELNGEKVQPVPDTVKINIQYPEKLEKSEDEAVSIVHFPDDAAIEVLDEAVIEQTPTEVKQVELSATSFSVYGIVGEKEPVIEYTFYAPKSIDANGNAKYDKYSYTDAAGNHVNTQFVANGSKIEYPGKPYAGIGDYVFEDWYFGEYDESGNPVLTDQKVDFDAPVATTERRKQPIIARYIHAKYGVFYDDADGKVVLAHVRYENGKIAAGAIQATPSDKDMAFMGWTTTKGSTEIINTDKEGNYTGTETNFYPVFANAYTLTYSTGEGSYVKPETVKPNENPNKPEDPHRMGYTFGGWYEDEACNSPFDFNKTLTASKTVYAKWEPAETTYTVIYWLQAITDFVDGPVHYEYADSEVLTAKTGSTINIDQTRIQNNRPLKDSNGKTTYSHKDEGVTVNGDGSTVVNVYYTRDVITYTFKNIGEETTRYKEVHYPNSGNTIYGFSDGNYVELSYVKGHWNGLPLPSNWIAGYWTLNGEKYSGPYYQLVTEKGDVVLKGLYGTSLEHNKVQCPNGPWESSYKGPNGNTVTRTYPFITHFIDPGNANRSEIVFTKVTDTNLDHKIVVYKQGLENGRYIETEYQSQPFEGSGTWYFTEQIDGFTVHSYCLANEDPDPNNEQLWEFTQPGGEVDHTNQNLYIRYSRNSYNLKFKNGSANYDNKSVLYEAKTKKSVLEVENPPYPGSQADADQYVFVGWFADPSCTTLIDFGTLTSGEIANIQQTWGIEETTEHKTMPSSDLEVYAGWFRKQFNVKLDLNGGSLRDDLPTEFKAKYGDELAGDYFTMPQRDGYTFVGWVVSNSDSSGAQEYWDPVRKVVSDTELKAVWKATGSFNIVYYDHEYNQPLTSLNIADEKFADSSSVSLKKPAAEHIPANKAFHGWILLDNQKNQVGSIYKPGESFVIDAASLAQNNNEIHVQMAVTEPGTTTLTYHRNTGGSNDPSQTVFDIAANTSTAGNEKKPIIKFPADWNRETEGYEFIGWNTKADGTGTSFTPGTTDYAVSKDGPNDLYAQYRRFYTVTVKKTVEGNFGDRFHDFEFTLDGDIEQLGDFTLKSGNQKTFKVYEGNSINLSEIAVEGYTTQIKITPKNGTTTTQNVSRLTGYKVSADTTVEFINTKNGAVPTGINDGSMIPYLALIIAGLGLGIAYVLILRRRQMYR